MESIVVLTATYNHPEELKRLYTSLVNQQDKGFTWFVVNDGSRQETVDAITAMQEENLLQMEVIHHTNRGKSRSINSALDAIGDGVDFILIIDDDENLYETAVGTVRKYVEEQKGTECGAIHFNRFDSDRNEIIADPYFDHDFFMSYQMHKAKKYNADGYVGYFTDKLGKLRFTEFGNEKYSGPATLMMKVTKNSKFLWSKEVLGVTSYLDGGITKQGRRLRVKNPLSMIEYCTQLQVKDSGLKYRLGFSMQGFAYLFISKKKYSEVKQLGIEINKLNKLMYIPGLILSIKWKKYLK